MTLPPATPAASARRGIGAIVLAVAALASAGTQAQELPQSFPAERLRPALDKNGIIDVEWGSVPDHLGLNAGVWAWYAHNPMVLYAENADGGVERVQTLVGNRLGGSALFSLGLFKRVQLGFELPFVLYQARPDPDPTRPGAALVGDQLQALGLGDLRVSPKIALWRVDGDNAPLDIAFIPTVTLPTAALLNDIILGAGDTRYMGESFFTLAPELAVSRQLGQVRLAANLGYRIRPPTTALDLEVGSEAFYRAGVAYRFDELLDVPLELGTSLGGQSTSFNPFAGINRNPLEWMAQVKYDVLPILQVHAGGGLGVLAGYATPDFRIFAGAQFVPPRDETPPKPADCAAGAEDFDGFEDDDHCIDPDNDKDGILDTGDACPLEPEDKDGHDDADGCPDPDNDGDGILDVNDKCPDVAEDQDGFEDQDGCIDPDNDGDGLLDVNDKCPNEPETINGNEDEDGCPDQGKTKVVITKEKIEILEKVYFDVNKATIQTRSFGLLDQVAAVLKNNKQLTKVRIEGHTDSDGSDASNLTLSQARTESVMKYLTDKGVEASRLEPIGYGETRPTVPNTNKANKEKNRRVEFAIVEVEGKPVENVTEVKTPAP